VSPGTAESPANLADCLTALARPALDVLPTGTQGDVHVLLTIAMFAWDVEVLLEESDVFAANKILADAEQAATVGTSFAERELAHFFWGVTFAMFRQRKREVFPDDRRLIARVHTTMPDANRVVVHVEPGPPKGYCVATRGS
jgi:hypothetical protein